MSWTEIKENECETVVNLYKDVKLTYKTKIHLYSRETTKTRLTSLIPWKSEKFTETEFRIVTDELPKIPSLPSKSYSVVAEIMFKVHKELLDLYREDILGNLRLMQISETGTNILVEDTFRKFKIVTAVIQRPQKKTWSLSVDSLFPLRVGVNWKTHKPDTEIIQVDPTEFISGLWEYEIERIAKLRSREKLRCIENFNKQKEHAE